MLSIPADIVALYKQDGVRKNFRVHFPDGEMNDLTNAQIVKESLSFTESVCSQEVFRFGLTEASAIQFSVVGVNNIYGVKIQCFIEIDISSLTAAQISAIQADIGDGALVLVGDSDIGFGYYQIPLGIFQVDSCQRKTGALEQRRITAVAFTPVSAQMETMETILSPYDSWKFKAKDVVYSAIGSLDPGQLSEAGYEDGSTYTLPTTESVSMGFSTGLINLKQHIPGIGSGASWTIGVSGRKWYISSTQSNVGVPFGGLGRITINGANPSSCLSWFENEFETVGVDLTQFDGTEYESKTYKEFVQKFVLPRISWRYYPNSYSLDAPNTNDWYWFADDQPAFLLSRVPKTIPSTYNSCPYLLFPWSITVRRGWDYSNPISLMAPSANEKPTVTRLVDASTDALSSVTITVDSTAKYDTSTPQQGYSFADAVNFQKLVSDYIELEGKLGRTTRTGGFELVSLGTSQAIQINDSEMEGCWFDDYLVNPIGKILYQYSDGDQTKIRYYIFAGYSSVYDLSGNSVLQMMDNATKANIEAILNESFVPNVQQIGFAPFEFDGLGLPFIEAADLIGIGTTGGVQSFALVRELSGVQYLRDHIEAKSGDLIITGSGHGGGFLRA